MPIAAEMMLPREEVVEVEDLPAWYADVIEYVVAGLRERAPLDASVRISVVELPGAWGLTRWNPETSMYEILLSPRHCCPQSLEDTIVHEWGHALVAGAAGYPMDHGPYWGVAYADAYRAASGVE